MNFNKHSDLEGRHAFLSASKYHWINYDSEKLSQAYLNFLATQKGTELHDFACQCIKLGIRLPKSKKTLNLYVNDAIGFRLTPEQSLYYSENSFGTADAIGFSKDALRVHDLKTGSIPASFRQLEVYDALFCLEYHIKPNDIFIENRIYQFDDFAVSNPEPDCINDIMNKIVEFDKRIEELNIGGI